MVDVGTLLGGLGLGLGLVSSLSCHFCSRFSLPFSSLLTSLLKLFSRFVDSYVQHVLPPSPSLYHVHLFPLVMHITTSLPFSFLPFSFLAFPFLSLSSPPVSSPAALHSLDPAQPSPAQPSSRQPNPIRRRARRRGKRKRPVGIERRVNAMQSKGNKMVVGMMIKSSLITSALVVVVLSRGWAGWVVPLFGSIWVYLVGLEWRRCCCRWVFHPSCCD